MPDLICTDNPPTWPFLPVIFPKRATAFSLRFLMPLALTSELHHNRAPSSGVSCPPHCNPLDKDSQSSLPSRPAPGLGTCRLPGGWRLSDPLLVQHLLGKLFSAPRQCPRSFFPVPVYSRRNTVPHSLESCAPCILPSPSGIFQAPW